MASPPADLPDLYHDPVNTARQTRGRFHFQDECVALRCIHNLISGEVASVVVEWSSDYLTVAADQTVELVSVKHREPDQPAWTRSSIAPVLVDLHRYWSAAGERCTCVFASSIGVSKDVTTLPPAVLAGVLKVPEPEAKRFWLALRLPAPATVLPRRSEITAVAIRDLTAVLAHYDRDATFAQQCYDALVARIAQGSIEEPPTPQQRIARLSGSIRSVLDRSGPDVRAQTLHLSDLRRLILATHDACAAERMPPIVVQQLAPVGHPPDDAGWYGGLQVRAAAGVFLVHAPVTVDRAADGSYICRRAKARQLAPVARDVWLTQVTAVRDSAAGRARLAALRQEADLLGKLLNVAGAPRLGAVGTADRTATDRTATLVVELPEARPLPEVFGPPGVPYPSPVLDALLRGLAPVFDVLGALHRLGHAHRALATDCLLATAKGLILLRDLGAATLAPVPGEGPADYRAPEQDRPLLVAPGAHTDVYQLAALIYHLATGQPVYLATGQPAGPAPMPPAVLRPDLSPQLGQALLSALDPDHARRSSLRQLRRDLAGVLRAGGTVVAGR